MQHESRRDEDHPIPSDGPDVEDNEEASTAEEGCQGKADEGSVPEEHAPEGHGQADDPGGSAGDERPHDPFPDMSLRDSIVLEALANLRTYEQAAQDARTSVKTVGRLVKNPIFMRRLNQVRAERLAEYRASLTSNVVAATPDAIATCVEVMKNRATSPSARLRAAQILLGLGARLEEQDLEHRVLMLEAAARKSLEGETDGS